MVRYDALKGPASVRLYVDERDAWGGLQDRRYEDRNVSFRLESIDKVESGKIRETIRVRLTYEGTRLEQLYTLGAGERELRVENRLCFTQPRALLKAAYPTGEDCFATRAETAYGIVERVHEADDGEYAFNLTEGRTQITVARSAIYAQGSSPDWERLPASELYRIAEKANGSYEYLMDSAHMPLTKNNRNSVVSSFVGTDRDNVVVQVVKKAEDDDGFIIRLLELEGEDTDYHLFLMGNAYPLAIGHYEIQTIKTDREGRRIKAVNLLEWEEERERNGER